MIDLFYRTFYAISYPLRLILRLPMHFAPASKRLLAMSLPARVALLVAIFLMICVVTAFVAFYQTPDRASW